MIASFAVQHDQWSELKSHWVSKGVCFESFAAARKLVNTHEFNSWYFDHHKPLGTAVVDYIKRNPKEFVTLEASI